MNQTKGEKGPLNDAGRGTDVFCQWCLNQYGNIVNINSQCQYTKYRNVQSYAMMTIYYALQHTKYQGWHPQSANLNVLSIVS